MKTNPDIVFVVSHANLFSEYMPFYYLYLSAFLEHHGFATEIFNERIRDNDAYSEAAVSFIQQKASRFVALASFATDKREVTRLAELIKSQTNAKILVGNAQPSVSPEEYVFPGSPFDIAILGEGEQTLYEILEGNALEDIDGVAYLADGVCKKTPKRKVIDLAILPIPAYHKIDMTLYTKPTKYLIRRVPASCAVIFIHRGCPFHCSFCAANSVWNANDCGNNGCVRKRKIESVIEELTLLENKYGFDFFYIMDDTFGLSAVDIIEFCDAYQNSGLTMLWAVDARVNSACFKDECLLEMMKRAGCIQIDMGVESGSQDVLDRIQKGITTAQIRHAFSLCHKHGIRCLANILINLPGETIADIEETDALLGRIRPTWVSIGATQPYPGTDCNRELGFPSKEDYSDMSRLTPLEKYRMASHHISLEKLLLGMQIKHGVFPVVETSIFYTDNRYWKKIIGSRHILAYLKCFIWDMAVGSVNMYFRSRLRYLKLGAGL